MTKQSSDQIVVQALRQIANTAESVAQTDTFRGIAKSALERAGLNEKKQSNERGPARLVDVEYYVALQVLLGEMRVLQNNPADHKRWGMTKLFEMMRVVDSLERRQDRFRTDEEMMELLEHRGFADPKRPRTPIVSLAGRAGHAFTPPTMVQGFACHARGAEILTNEEKLVIVRTRSSRIFDVVLRELPERKLGMKCGCPSREFGLDVCKHMWAALLEVDRQGGLEGLRDRRTNILVVVRDPPGKSSDGCSQCVAEGLAPATKLKTRKRGRKR